MILTVDVSNSVVQFSFCDKDGNFAKPYRIAADNRQTEYDYATKLHGILSFAGIACTDISDAVICSVVPSLLQTIKNAVMIVTGKRPLVVGAGVKTGIHISVDDPATVGSDLVATAVGAKNMYSLPCIIVDVGTATTITVIDKGGCYIGGSIMPGVVMSLDALSKTAALLPHIELGAPQKVIPSNTADSMRAGIIYGSAGAIDGILDRYINALGDEVTIVATGDNAKQIVPFCRNNVLMDDLLVHKGLYYIWKKNQK